MFTEDIINIITKYQSKNEEISTINAAIDEIIYQLNNINENIIERLKPLLNNININTIEEEKHLLQDSQMLRKFISTISTVECNKSEPIQKQNEVEGSGESFPQPLFDKKVYPYLVDDDICPFCNVKLQPYTIYYKRIVDGSIIEEMVQWYRCPSCKKMFVLDYDVNDFDFDNTNIFLNRTKYDVIPPIDIYSLIVLSNTIKCSINHKTKDIIAKLPVLNEEGQISYLEVSASYCFNCKRFTILKDDFLEIKDIIICKVIDETVTDSLISDNSEFNINSKDSILTQYGYNVQAKKNLSEQQRHIILSSLIEAQIMSRREVMEHISTLIERGNKIPLWKAATQKWKDDKNFVSEYKKEDLPDIIFNNILLKYRNYECLTIED